MIDQFDGSAAPMMSGIQSGKNGRIKMTQKKKLGYHSGAS
jgi:hypothetical protein